MVTAVRTEVDDMVGTLDDLHVMLDDEDGVAPFDEGIEGLEQPLDVMEVQTRRRLVEDEQRGLLLLLSDEIGEFHALVLTTGERGGVLAEFDIAESHLFESFQTLHDRLAHLSCLLVSLSPCLLKEVNGF